LETWRPVLCDPPFGRSGARRVIREGTCPETERAIAAGSFDDDSIDDDLRFGLDRVLDGIQVLVDR
jgi:hypothetical protein